MSTIFISHSSKDNFRAEQIAAWLKDEQQQRSADHRYDSLFLDFDPEDGIPSGQSWRATLYRKLQVCRAVIVVCSRHYCASQWCLAELGIAIHEGKLVLPVRIDKQKDHSDLPRLLSENQAWVLEAIDLAEGSVAGWGGLERGLEGLSWRERLTWKEGQCPYPGLPAFSRKFAPVFFGRDAAITRVQQKLNGLAERSPAFLLLLGASGCGKSSLVRAGVLPQLVSGGEQKWLLLEPFGPGKFPFAALNRVLRHPLAAVKENPPPAEAASDHEADGLVNQLHWLRSVRQTTLVLVIDQFEELLSQLSGEGEQPSEGERFLAFLRTLLSEQLAGVMVLATMRTDFLDLLQSRWPDLVGMATTEALEPIRPEDFAELITGPAARSGLTLEPGLTERLVSESGGRDALPLLAFTLEKLWQKREKRGAAVAGPAGSWWDLTVEDFDALGGVDGAVSSQAAICWNPATSSAADEAALREVFLDHLVTLNENGLAGKRAARLVDLPERSQPMVRRFVDARLLVSDTGMVEIAHEALLRTWEPLMGWLEEGREEMELCRRVRRLCDDLSAESQEQQRRGALETMAGMAARGGSEGRAVRKEAAGILADLLRNLNLAIAEADRQDTALVLALIGEEEPLRLLLADGKAPVGLRRQAAECLGLLARRCGNPDQRKRIAKDLEGWLRSDALNVLVLDAEGWAEHDARLPLLQGASRGLQLAASADLPLLGSGPGLVVTMLTLSALEESGGLRMRTEVVEVPVWKLPLPGGEQLELVAVKGGEAPLGSPATEHDRQAVLDWFANNREGCRDGVDVEALRLVRLEAFALVRQPISQAQWRAVLEAEVKGERELDAAPSKANPVTLWERHGQPGELPADSVSWHQGREWLRRLNRWLEAYWQELGGSGEPPQLALPSENQWEGACRAGCATPFHFGDTLDGSWARYDASANPFGRGREAVKPKQAWINGSSGLVNRWGLAEMHGQLLEWCEDNWHPNPVGKGHPEDGEPWRGEDPDLARRESGQRDWKLVRGGSWFDVPHFCRTAMRISTSPDYVDPFSGLRPCCSLSPRTSSWHLSPLALSPWAVFTLG